MWYNIFMSKTEPNFQNSPKVDEKVYKDYLDRIAAASDRVERVLKKHPEFDVSDLFRIAMLRDETNEAKLATGLRRRIIGHV